ncbi:MAG: hybrid sensor histidine kinase/response regulator [Verrucomicrobia bacterium]|nr:hybrid sensor histidine kinase/response regulator [Verrucomicrobiota bacterium]
MTRILVVDDEQSIRLTLQEFLQEAGYHVEVAEDAKAAQQLLKDGNFDVVVSDIVLPRISGVELLQAIRKESPRVLVIMMTGQPAVDTAAAAVRAGAFDYLFKPVPKEAILRCVGNAAKFKAVEDERLRLAEANRRYQEDLERQHQQLRDNYARLRELETLRDNLTHMIIHDLRAPLSIALGYLDLVKDHAASKLGSDDMGYLDTILMNICRLNDMIGSLLDISRLETGNMPLNRRACDVTTLARSVMESFDSLVEGRRLVFDSPSPSVMASCDEEITRRVLGNLLQNSLKFTPKDGSIRVAVSRKDGMVRLEVSDTGPGIAPEYHGRIFEKFGYVAKPVHQYSTGLGLTFCKLAVEAQGGQIGIESEVGKGSTFWFTLPPA